MTYKAKLNRFSQYTDWLTLNKVDETSLQSISDVIRYKLEENENKQEWQTDNCMDGWKDLDSFISDPATCHKHQSPKLIFLWYKKCN
jgi:hypothetical protein